MTRTCPACAATVGPTALGPAAPRCAACPADLPGAAGSPGGTATGGSPPPPPAPPAVVLLPLVEPPPAAREARGRPGWPCSRCAAVVPFEAAACPVCGSGFLAPLAGAGRPRVPGGRTPVARAARLLATVGLGAGLLLLAAALGAGTPLPG